MRRETKKKQKEGQAMVEFIVAIFIVVIIISGLTEFIGMAGKRDLITAEIRGKVGKVAIEDRVFDDTSLDLSQEPKVEMVEGVLLRGVKHDSHETKISFSKALREWVFGGKRDEVVVRGEVWMPGMKVGGMGEEK